jgi:hypothetical protein
MQGYLRGMLLIDASLQGPARPMAHTPELPPGSVRRTTSIDSSSPDGFTGDLLVTARGRDAVSREGGGFEVVQELTLQLGVGRATRHVLWVDPVELDLLVGAAVASGFRSDLARLLPQECEARSLLHTILDDLVGAVLVSGGAMLHAGFARPRVSDVHSMTSIDICAGWVRDGVMVTTMAEQGEMPVSQGPRAPLLERADAWHELPAMPVHSTRRQRRLDLRPDCAVESFFRDSRVDGEAEERIVHEYLVHAQLSPDGATVQQAHADADVLPWMECPRAVDSAGRIAGTPVAQLRATVRRDLRGATTCTHLNDTLRVVEDVTALWRLRPPG